MEKTLYIDNSKYSVEVSCFDWHQSQNEIQCILIFLSNYDKKRFIKEIEEYEEIVKLDNMFLSCCRYNDINDTQAIAFFADYAIPPENYHIEEPSLCEEFGFNPDEVIF